MRLRRPVRGEGRAREEGEVLDAGRGGRLVSATSAGRSAARRRSRRRPRRSSTRRAHVQGPDRAARRVDDRARRRHGRAWARARPLQEARDPQRGPGTHAAEPRALARRRASRRVRLGLAEGDVPAEPRRPRRAALLAADRGRARPPRRRASVVHDDVRPRQHLHEPAGAAVHARAGRDDAARARRLAGRTVGRLPRRGSRPDPPRDALRRDDGVRGAAALAVLRLRRRDAALRRAARRVRALDGRPSARPRARDRGARRAQLDRRVRRPPGHGLHLVPAPQRGDRAREPVLEGLVGLDLVPRRRASRLPARDVRAPGLRLRREDARRAAGARDLEGRGARRQAREGRRRPQAALQPRLLGRGRRVLRARARPATATRSTRSRRTTAICSGAGSSTSRRRRRSHGTSWGRGSSPAGASARWPRARAATTRSATTSARSGRSTTRSSRGACGGTGSRTRRPRSPPASSTPPSSSTAGCPRRSAATRARRRSTRSSTRPRAARRRGRPARRCCSSARCSASSRIGDHLVVDPALPQRDRPPRAARHPRPLGPDRRLRPRPRRDRSVTAGAR